MTDQTTYPPTIIAFSDAMRLLQMARDALDGDEYVVNCILACERIAKAFEREGDDAK